MIKSEIQQEIVDIRNNTIKLEKEKDVILARIVELDKKRDIILNEMIKLQDINQIPI